MTRSDQPVPVRRTSLRRWMYRFSGFVLIAPAWFFYEAMSPPPLPQQWQQQSIGPFTAAPQPANNDAPYPHDGAFAKDFSVHFCAGCVERIRVAWLSVGEQPSALPDDLAGILHGNNFEQHVHAPFPKQRGNNDKLWLTVQQWNGQTHHAAWPLP